MQEPLMTGGTTAAPATRGRSVNDSAPGGESREPGTTSDDHPAARTSMFMKAFTSFNGGIYHESLGCAKRRNYVMEPNGWPISELLWAHPFITACSVCVTWRFERRVRHARSLLRRFSQEFDALFYHDQRTDGQRST